MATNDKKPNTLVICGDDSGISNLSYSGRGLMGHQTPNSFTIDEALKTMSQASSHD